MDGMSHRVIRDDPPGPTPEKADGYSWLFLVIFLAALVCTTRAQASDVDVCKAGSQSPDAAIEACSRLIASGPFAALLARKKLAVIYSNRCLAWIVKASFDEAFKDCDEAISLDPESGIAYNNRGTAFLGLGDFDKAITELGTALRFSPTLSVAFSNRCFAYLNKPDATKALADCDQAISLNPNSASAYNFRAIAWRMKGDFDRALSDFNSAIRVDPRFALAYVSRCITLSLRNEHDRALDDCNAAIRLNPQPSVLSVAYNYRGQISEAKGDSDRALADYNAAIRLNQKSVSALKNRGLLYERTQKTEAARADYEASLKIVARDLVAKQAQEFVRKRLAALSDSNSIPPTATGTSEPRLSPKVAPIARVFGPGTPLGLPSPTNPPTATERPEPSQPSPAPPVSTTRATLVPMRFKNGTFSIPVLINDKLMLDFVLDSGASDVAIPADVVRTLMRTGTLSDADFLETKTYRMADGSTVPGQTFRIRLLKVGDKVLENVTGGVVPVGGSLLLGQSFLRRLKSWSIDNERMVLVVE